MQRNRLLFALLVMLVVFGLDAFAVPKVRVVALRQGNASLANGNSVGRLEWRIDNPDASADVITLKLSSTGGFSPNIYSREIRLPAKSTVNGFAYLFLNVSEKYAVECFHKGKTLYRESILLNLRSMSHFGIGLLNDNFNVRGYGRIQKMRELPHRVTFTSFMVPNVPDHWGHFGNLSMLVLLDVELDSYSSSQLGAIVDFVAMGEPCLLPRPRLHCA